MELFTQKDQGTIYGIAFWCAILSLIIIPIQIIVFAIWPMPTHATAWLDMFMEHPIIAFLHLDFLYLFTNALVCMIYLALFVALSMNERGLATIALISGLIGVAAFFPGVKAVEVYNISLLYHQSDNAMFREGLKAVVEGMITEWKGSGFGSYYILNGVCILVFGIALLRSNVFNRAIAVFALLSGILMLVPSTLGNIGLIFSLLSLIPWIIFTIMLIPKFWVLSHPQGS